jgi:hypothetical protein
MQMQDGCPVLVEGDLVRAVRQREPPGEHLRYVDQMPEPAVGWRHHLSRRPRVQGGEWCDRGDARQPGERPVVAAEPGAARRDQHVGRVRGLQKARICAVGPPRPRNGGQDSTPGEGHKKYEHRPAPPPGPEPVRSEMQDRAHPVSRPPGARPPSRT